MGRMQAGEMAARLPREVAVAWHLQYNHYPPVNRVFVVVALEAIEKAEAGDWKAAIDMPNGRSLTVGEIIEGLHLESFLTMDGEEKDNE